MAVLRTDLRQILRPAFDMPQGLFRCQGQLGRFEPPATLVSVSSPRLVDHIAGALKIAPMSGRQSVEIKVPDTFVACIVDRADEDGIRWNDQTALGKRSSNTRVVRHLGVSPRVGAAAPAPAG